MGCVIPCDANWACSAAIPPTFLAPASPEPPAVRAVDLGRPALESSREPANSAVIFARTGGAAEARRRPAEPPLAFRAPGTAEDGEASAAAGAFAGSTAIFLGATDVVVAGVLTSDGFACVDPLAAKSLSLATALEPDSSAEDALSCCLTLDSPPPPAVGGN